MNWPNPYTVACPYCGALPGACCDNGPWWSDCHLARLVEAGDRKPEDAGSHRAPTAPLAPTEHHPKGNPPVTELQALERCYTLAQDRNAELADMVARLTVENVRLRRELGHG